MRQFSSIITSPLSTDPHYVSLCRGGSHQAQGVRQQIQVILADPQAGLQGGGQAGALQGPRDPAGEADPQHGHHDGDLRADGLHSPPVHSVISPPSQLSVEFIQRLQGRYL